MSKVEWKWYGTWIVDWLTCDQGNLSSTAWASYDIWKKAYIEARPELSEATDLELIENHYSSAIEPVFNSWVFGIYLALQWPINTVRSTIWTIKRKFF